MEKTVFQKIIDREIPAIIIYEDEKYLCFLDIFPKTQGHALVITKHPYPWVIDVPEFGEYFEVAKKIGIAIEKALGAAYISFQTFGTEIPHAHIHVVPHYDLSEGPYKRTKPTPEELDDVAEKIKKAL